MQPGQQLLTVPILMGSKEFEEVERNARVAPRETIKEILKVFPVLNFTNILHV